VNIGELWRRLLHLFRRERVTEELEEEMRLHLELRADANRQAGMGAGDAQSAARRRFGNRGALQMDSRDVWRLASLESFAQGFQHAFRSLRRAPGFVALATLSTGVGIGLSTSVYAMIDRLMHPLTPYANVDELFRPQVYGYSPRRGPTNTQLLDELARGGVFGAVTMQSPNSGYLDASGIQDVRWYSRVAPNFFEVLGVRPRLGRVFTPDEMGTQNVAVVSDAVWRSRFRGRRAIGDAAITLGDRTYAVIGVMPPNFEQSPLPTDVWLPFPSEGAMRGQAFGFLTIRVKPGVSAEALRLQLKSLSNELTKRFAAPGTEISVFARPLRPDPLRLSAYHAAMIGAALGILLIACANVSALMLARGLGHQRDSALRLSLGASRAVLVRDVLTEVAILTGLGCAVGLLAARWGLSALSAAVPPEMASLGLTDLSWSWRVFAGAFGAALASAGLAAILPSLQASRIDPAEPLKESSGTTTGRARARFNGLVVAELALSMVLLIGASLMVKATLRVAQYDFGFDASAALNVYANEAPTRAPGQRAQRSTDDLAPIIARVRTVPGVDGVTSTSGVIPDNNLVISEVTASGASPLALHAYQRIGLDYIKTLGLQLKQGRDVNESDRGRGAVILEERAAQVLFPRGSAIGRMVKLGDNASSQPWLPVVGVVRNTAFGFYDDPDQHDEPKVFAYAPSEPLGSWRLVVHQARGARGVPYAIQRRVQDALGSKSYVGVFPLLANYEGMLRGRYFVAGVFALLGLASLILAAAGLFSVLSYAVGRRMREFAVRIALGARPEDVLRLVLRDGLELALGGTAVGALGGMWAGTLLSKWLYDVHPADVTALVAAELVLLVVTLLSCLVPAVRAMRADPVEVLRAS
jgi:putative ABC transport system permease protein